MDCDALIESLWRDGKQKIQEIEAETKEEVDRIEREISLTTTALKEKYEKDALSLAAKKTGDSLAKAEQQAVLIGNSASRELSVRLYQLACSSLPLLRSDRYVDVFKALAEELPLLSWRFVKINPDDVAIAEQCFPGAEITSDNTISGGMDVMTDDGRVRVINTFEKRLERAWEEMSPGLLQEDYEAL